MKQTKKIKLFFLCTVSLLSTLIITHTTFAQSPQKAQFPAGGMQMQPGAFPPGFSMADMPVPNEAELEEALKFIQYLEENDPEQLKMLEQLGQQMINQMSDEDLGQLSDMFNIAPDELREEARKGISDFTPPSFPTEPGQPAAPAAKPTVTPAARQQAGAVVKDLIDSLASLRQKASSVREVHQLIRSWRQELRDLMFYLKLIDEKQHHQRLAQAEFKQLYQSLNNLYASLKVEEPRVVLPDDLTLEDNAYSLLGLQTGASEKKIEEAFKKLEEEYNTDKLKARLTAEGLTEKDIKRQVKAKKLAFEVIEDAYEQLSDPKSRKQIDREIAAQEKKSQQDIANASTAIANITAALGQAIYNEEILDQLERFLQLNAPEELKQKKAMDAAEKKQLEEQKRLGKITPSKTSGSFEPRVNFPRGGNYANDYGYYDDFSPYMYDDYYNYPNYSYNDYQQPTEQPSDKSKDSGSSSTKDKDTSKKDGASSSSPHAEQAAAAKKIDSRSVDAILKDINKNLDIFQAEATKATIQKFITGLDSYMHQTTRTVKRDASKEEIDKAYVRIVKGLQEPGDEELIDKRVIETESKDTPDSKKTTELEKLYKAAKLKELDEDMTKLNQILRIKKDAKRTTAESESWNKLEERVEKYQPTFTQLSKNLTAALQGNVMPEKKDLHGKAVQDIISSIDKFSKQYDTVKKKF